MHNSRADDFEIETPTMDPAAREVDRVPSATNMFDWRCHLTNCVTTHEFGLAFWGELQQQDIWPTQLIC